MSSRHQKDKRLRPKSDPYKRDHFNKSRYMGQAMPSKGKQALKQEAVEQADTDGVEAVDMAVVGDETVVSSSVVAGVDGQRVVSYYEETEEP